MAFYELAENSPSRFIAAAMGLIEPFLRDELETKQIPAPDKIAPFALAFAAQVPNPANTPNNRGVGRIVFLYDENQFETWGSNMRVIAYGKSPLEQDIGIEEDMANYCWEWLTRALERHDAKFSNEAGTITKIVSTGMGSLSQDSNSSEVEIRASWSPQDDNFGPHLAAWQDLIAGMAGFELGGDKVTRLARSK